ncbi:uncharacterized protein LOC111042226 [Myzus persicae]|uniref:uncharacterized protein LOC111042226 n=1 Tax=Myzus persicae TaxID=13164 RepID=UPI000B934C39|nr:uncharacterized protein LOC111042226 [Myzus persicae]
MFNIINSVRTILKNKIKRLIVVENQFFVEFQQRTNNLTIRDSTSRSLREYATWIIRESVQQLNRDSLVIVFKKKRVCSDHFESTCYSPSTKALNRNAVPSLNISIAKNSNTTTPEIMINDRIKSNVDDNTSRSSTSTQKRSPCLHIDENEKFFGLTGFKLLNTFEENIFHVCYPKLCVQNPKC